MASASTETSALLPFTGSAQAPGGNFQGAPGSTWTLQPFSAFTCARTGQHTAVHGVSLGALWAVRLQGRLLHARCALIGCQPFSTVGVAFETLGGSGRSGVPPVGGVGQHPGTPVDPESQYWPLIGSSLLYRCSCPQIPAVEHPEFPSTSQEVGVAALVSTFVTFSRGLGRSGK